MAKRKSGATADAGKVLHELLESVPRVLALVHDETTEYIGPALVQAPGAWTRCGPTWLTKRGLWICVGPGVYDWGTTAGLAQLASSPDPKPKWHAHGVAIVPDPNIVFVVGANALTSPEMADVRAMTAAAEEMEAGIRRAVG